MDSNFGFGMSASVDDEIAVRGSHANEFPGEMNGAAEVSEIEYLGSDVEAEGNESPASNGPWNDPDGQILHSAEANGNTVASGDAMETPLKDVESPSEIPTGLANVGTQSKPIEDQERIGQFYEAEPDSSISHVRNLFPTPDSNEHGLKNNEALETREEALGSPGESGSSPTTKGKGLKKWRRRTRRDLAKDGAVSGDPNRILKRGLTNPEHVKLDSLCLEYKPSEDSFSRSVASVNLAAKDAAFNGLSVGGSDSESSRLAVETSLATKTDYENSEDQSNNSTAASAPKLRMKVPLIFGSVKDKTKKSSKGPGYAVHKARQAKGKVENSKKLRGESDNVKMEHSHSSVESDLNSKLLRMEADAFIPAVGEGQRDDSSNCDEENSKGLRFCELQAGAEVEAENQGEAEFVSTADVEDCLLEMKKNKGSESSGQNMDQDPLAESVVLLQSVQEALEKEIRCLGEIGKEPVSPPDSSSCGASSSAQVLPEEVSSSPKNPLLAELSQKVSFLEHELEVATAAVKAKESKVQELKSILNPPQFPKQEDQDSLKSLEEMLMETERGKIEAEVMLRHAQELKKIPEERSSLLDEVKTLVENHGQMMVKLRDAEAKAKVLQTHVEELEASSRDLADANRILKMQNDACKSTLCSFAQLTLLCIAFAFFLLQLFPHSNGVVPT